jgi:hypothetical protein
MLRRPLLLAVIAAAVLVSACGSSAPDAVDTLDAATNDTIVGVEAPAVTTAAPARIGSIGDAVEVAVGALAGADAAACDLDRRALEDASELYLVLNGSLPPTQSALVEAQILREPSARFEITAEGVIVPGPGSPCV